MRWDLSEQQEGKSITGCQGCSDVVVDLDSQICIVEMQRHRVLRGPFGADRVENCDVVAGVTDERQRSPQHLNGPTMFAIDDLNQRILRLDPNNERSQSVFYNKSCYLASLIVDARGTIDSTVSCHSSTNKDESFILRIRPDDTTDRITIDSMLTRSIHSHPHPLTWSSVRG